jgi:hypothetical protein
MEPRGGEVRRVPDIVQDRGCHEHFTVNTCDGGDSLRLVGDRADVIPTPRQFAGQSRVRGLMRPLDQVHHSAPIRPH